MKRTYISIEWGDQRTRYERAGAIKKALKLAEKRSQELSELDELKKLNLYIQSQKAARKVA